MTTLDIDGIMRLHGATTKEWVSDHPKSSSYVYCVQFIDGRWTDGFNAITPENAHFIAAAHAQVPLLVQRVRELEREVEGLESIREDKMGR